MKIWKSNDSLSAYFWPVFRSCVTLVEWDVKVPPSKMANSPGLLRHSLTLPHERGLPNGLKTTRHEGKDDRKGRAGPGRQTTLKWFPQEFFLSVEHASFRFFPTHLWGHLNLWSCSKPCRARDGFLLLWGNFFFFFKKERGWSEEIGLEKSSEEIIGISWRTQNEYSLKALNYVTKKYHISQERM